MTLVDAFIVAIGFPSVFELLPLSQNKVGRAIGRWYCPYFLIDWSVFVPEAYGFPRPARPQNRSKRWKLPLRV